MRGPGYRFAGSPEALFLAAAKIRVASEQIAVFLFKKAQNGDNPVFGAKA